MKQTTEQVRTKKVPRKFTGDMIITPDCLGDFLGFLLGNIGNQPLISGTSLYKDSLGQPVADAALTLHSRPRDLVGGYFVTGDGYEAGTRPWSKKATAQPADHGAETARRVTGGGAWVVDAGSTPLDA
jgi:PmbA protein